MTGVSSDKPSTGLSPLGNENMELKDDESFERVVLCTCRQDELRSMIAKETHVEQSLLHQKNATSIGEIVIFVADDFRSMPRGILHAGFFSFEKVAGSFPWWGMEKLSGGDFFCEYSLVVGWNEQRCV